MSRIIGAHVLLYSTNADADRAFVRDVSGSDPSTSATDG